MSSNTPPPQQAASGETPEIVISADKDPAEPVPVSVDSHDADTDLPLPMDEVPPSPTSDTNGTEVDSHEPSNGHAANGIQERRAGDDSFPTLSQTQSSEDWPLEEALSSEYDTASESPAEYDTASESQSQAEYVSQARTGTGAPVGDNEENSSDGPQLMIVTPSVMDAFIAEAAHALQAGRTAAPNGAAATPSLANGVADIHKDVVTDAPASAAAPAPGTAGGATDEADASRKHSLEDADEDVPTARQRVE